MSKYFPYPLLNKIQICQQINCLAENAVPFVFIINYQTSEGYVIPYDELIDKYIRFSINNIFMATTNETDNHLINKSVLKSIQWKVNPPMFPDYQTKFNYVVSQIGKGNSFLTNLTQPSVVETNLTLLDFYQFGQAKYKLWLNDRFAMLSPETFIQINNGIISSFPMKGTIDADIPNAESIIKNDPKEKAEHATIVDLIRNDLSMIADGVEVKRYRYIDKLTTNQTNLLQVSSQISGRLPEGYHSQLGDIIFALLPAGSICGAPKSKTLDIIRQAEAYDRGFYTGIFGFFDGKNLDSAVMIRFLEQHGEELIFKSGGGITSQSDAQKEYEELIQKVYVPIS